MGSASVERIDLTLVGAVDAATISTVGCRSGGDVCKLWRGCTAVEPSTIDSDVVALVGPRSIHVGIGTTGVFFESVVGAVS